MFMSEAEIDSMVKEIVKEVDDHMYEWAYANYKEGSEERKDAREYIRELRFIARRHIEAARWSQAKNLLGGGS
jgi:hypothetical protein